MYIEQAAYNGKNDNCSDRDDNTIRIHRYQLCAMEKKGGYRSNTYQLQALRAETTGFMVTS